KNRGIGILYISHFLEEIRRVCDDFCVLRDGRSVGRGELSTTSESQIIGMMAGRTVEELFPTVPHEPAEPILTMTGLSGRGSPRDVSLQLHRGEILGIAGLVGAGRTELLRCLFGLDTV